MHIAPPKTGSSCPKGSARLVCARKEDMTKGHRTFGRRRRKSLLRRLVTTALLFSTCLIIYFILTSWEKQREVSVASGRVSASVSLAAPSSMFSADLASPWANLPPMYPYSVIPGGVRTVKELKSAIAHDPLVKAHQDFNLAKARLIRLKENREVYVSYRRGSAIFWTRRKLVLQKGETLITDGTNLSRTRCGNRTADTPSFPRSPQEPNSEVFNTPIIPPAFPSPGDPPILASTQVILTPTPPGGSIFIPSIIPIVPGGGSSLPAPPGLPGGSLFFAQGPRLRRFPSQTLFIWCSRRCRLHGSFERNRVVDFSAPVPCSIRTIHVPPTPAREPVCSPPTSLWYVSAT
jgi:hypothetical protein